MLDRITTRKLKKTIDFAQKIWYYNIKEREDGQHERLMIYPPNLRKRYRPMG